MHHKLFFKIFVFGPFFCVARSSLISAFYSLCMQTSMTVSIVHALTADRVWMVSIVTRAAAWRDTLGTTAKKVKFMCNLPVLNSQSPVLVDY